MGYSYDMKGRLACDHCGVSGGVGKIPCPFGWCPAPALCRPCRKALAHDLTPEAHRARGCERHSLEFHRQRQERQEMLEAGQFVRCAALRHDGHIKVVFDGKAGSVAYFMSPATYEAIPILVNATPQDYERLGTITKAQTAEIYENR